MTINVELSDQELAALKKLIQLDNDAAAISKAAREFLRLRRLRELKGVSGKVEFESSWQELVDLELRELDFPQ
jgi:hypothetical protein